MAKSNFISPAILFQLRTAFSGKRRIIAEKSGYHYNSVCSVLAGDLFNEEILTTMCDFLAREEESEELLKLRELIIKIIKKRKKLYVTAEAA
jgi:hypothetical protein